jgi:hypothetical protein
VGAAASSVCIDPASLPLSNLSFTAVGNAPILPPWNFYYVALGI